MARRHLGFPLAFTLALFAACGGTDDGRPPTKPPPPPSDELDPCKAADGYTQRTLVDFEGELRPVSGYPDPRANAVCDPSVCQSSPFFVNYDLPHSNEDPSEIGSCVPVSGEPLKTQGCDCKEPVNPGVVSSSDPAVGSNLFGRPMDGGGRCSVEGNALHFTATNIAMCYGSNGRLGWGAGIDVKFLTSGPIDDGAGGADGGLEDEAHPPGSNGYDAGGWDGISFWVRRGNPNARSSFIVSIADPGTTPAASQADGCTDAEDAPDAEKCDAFGVAVTATDEWTFVPAYFRAMRQKGFGRPSPLGRLDSANIAKLQFLMSAGNWDLWIDDIAFFRAPEAGR